jgi:Uma2 family endonuclease
MSVSSEIPGAISQRYKNAAEWLRDLGDVPLERIIFDPWPGSATEADLLRKVEVEKQLCELIDGTLVEKPMGWYESILAMLLGRELLNFVVPRRLGAVAGPDGPLRFRIGLVRLPDISFISARQLKSRGGAREAIPSLIPELVAEVLSASNRAGEMTLKLNEYFSAGVRLVWYMDPATRTADVYTAIDSVQHVEQDGFLEGLDVLPGFNVRLSDLFKAADECVEGMQ